MASESLLMLQLPGFVKATRTPLSNTSLTSARHGLENPSPETPLWKTVSNTDICQQITAWDSSKACSAGHTALKMLCQLHYTFCYHLSSTMHMGQGCRKGSSWSAPSSAGFILRIFNTAMIYHCNCHWKERRKGRQAGVRRERLVSK